MSINFNLYGDQVRKTERMSIHNLEVGQKVIRLHRPKIHFGTALGEFKTSEYTVKKVLKTRLVLESAQGVELRMLVETGSWSMRVGDIKTDQEGASDSWNRLPIELATEDEAELIESIRKHYADEKQKQDDRNAAKVAVEAVRNDLGGYPSLDKVEAAIQALQALADQLRGAE